MAMKTSYQRKSQNAKRKTQKEEKPGGRSSFCVVRCALFLVGVAGGGGGGGGGSRARGGAGCRGGAVRGLFGLRLLLHYDLLHPRLRDAERAHRILPLAVGHHLENPFRARHHAAVGGDAALAP